MPEKILYTKYNRTRDPRFQISTTIVERDGQRRVIKRALTPEAVEHIKSMAAKAAMLEGIYANSKPVGVAIVGDAAEFDFVMGIPASDIVLEEATVEARIAKMKEILAHTLAVNEAATVPFEQTMEFVEIFGSIEGIEDAFAAMPCSKGVSIDLILDNLIFDGSRWYMIDYEWCATCPVPTQYVYDRSVYFFYKKNEDYFSQYYSENEFLSLFGIEADKHEIYLRMTNSMQQYVQGEGWKYINTQNSAKRLHRIEGLLKDEAFVDTKLEQKEIELQGKEIELQGKEIELQGKEEHLKASQEHIKASQEHIKNLDEHIHNLNEHIQNLNSIMDGKDKYAGELLAELTDVVNSRSWKLTAPLRAVKRRARGLREYGFSGAVEYMRCGSGQGIENYFNEKIDAELFVIDKEEAKAQRNTKFKHNIKFSILVPLYNTPEKFLREMIESVANQTYKNWELCLADGSDADHDNVGAIALEYARKDSRIRYQKLEKNDGISGNTNACFEMAKGDYIGLFDHDDLLHPFALFEYAKRIDETGAEQLYCDEGVFEKTPRKVRIHHYKPDYSPDLLRTNNYICHFTVFKKSILDGQEVFRSAYDGSQDYDLILRLSERVNRIEHVPKVLYFWRAHENSTAKSNDAKPYTALAGQRALEDHLKRVNLFGEVNGLSSPGLYRVSYEIKGMPKLSLIVVCNDGNESNLSRCVASIVEKSTYKNYEIIIVNNGCKSENIYDCFEELKRNYNAISLIESDEKLSPPAALNLGASKAGGEYIIFLSSLTEVITSNWMEEMLMFAQRADVGAVGAKLYDENNAVCHAGLIIERDGRISVAHKGVAPEYIGYFGRAIVAQNFSAVGSECMMISTSIYKEMGGFDEGFVDAKLSAVDLCLKIRQVGYLISWTPFAQLRLKSSEKEQYDAHDATQLLNKWGRLISDGDAYYNVNLPGSCEDFVVRV